jgi:hypothetical protein
MRLHSLPSCLYQFRPLSGLRFYLADLCRAILDPHSRIAYAQWGEDLALQHLLGTQPGFYVEVGANHPQFFSNVFELYRRGWHGISVEANESFIRAHRRCRPRDQIVCAVVSDQEKEVASTEFKNSLVSSVDSAFVENMQKYLIVQSNDSIMFNRGRSRAFLMRRVVHSGLTCCLLMSRVMTLKFCSRSTSLATDLVS